MKKRYEDCIRSDGACGACSLVSYGRDCHNKKINELLRLRSIAGLSQQKLAEKAGVGIRQIQKYESGEYDIGNMTLKNAIALAGALECDVRELITHGKQ